MDLSRTLHFHATSKQRIGTLHIWEHLEAGEANLNEGVTVGLKGGAVGDAEALAAGASGAHLPQQRGHPSLVALIQGCINLIQQEQPRSRPRLRCL